MASSDVLLVGSIPLGSASEVFEITSKALGSRLQRIPDGETGSRASFIAWQLPVFPKSLLQPRWGGEPTPESLSKTYSVSDLKPTGYDDQAFASYGEFRKLRDAGTIAGGTRFQVCFPSPLSVARSFIEGLETGARIEPLYQERLFAAVRNVQDKIPHTDLSIQWDCPSEIAALETDAGRPPAEEWRPYFDSIKEEVSKRFESMARTVDADVELGFHLCYGDYFRQHFIEPVDSELLVETANNLVDKITAIHPVKYIHMPVPKGRTDAAYHKPLKKLALQETQLYLGLVHASDEEGTRKRIETAQEFSPVSFGVATECGMGRISRDELQSILDIAASVTKAE